MKTVFGIENLEPFTSGSVLTIGNFDGLHLGHRRIISRVVEEARKRGCPSVVYTFDPHPRQFLRPDPGFKPLFERRDLPEVLDSMGIDFVVIEPFTRALSQMPADDFFANNISKIFYPTHLVVGYDFTFGTNRTGTLERLKALCEKNRTELEIVPEVKVNNQTVSSTNIRKAVIDGNVELATQMLGRRYFLEGIVEKGEGRGSKIGIPTANLRVADITCPKLGVYSAWLEEKGKRHKAVVNIGINPTFHGPSAPVKIEAHILDFDGDIYGQPVRLTFVQRLRDEKRFEGVGALVEQIKKDIENARQSLAQSNS